MAAVAERTGTADLVTPPHGAGRERVEQNLPQVAALHLRASTGPVVGPVEPDGAVRVEDPQCLAALQNNGPELVRQPGRLDRELPVVVVDVQQSALGARRR